MAIKEKKVKMTKAIKDFASKEHEKYLRAFEKEKEKELKKLERKPSFTRKLAKKFF